MTPTPLFFVILFSLIGFSRSWAQPGIPDTFKISDTETMYKYSFCLLLKGPNRSQSPEEANSIQEGHMANLNNLEKSGYLWLAGPFDFEAVEQPDWRGIVVLRARVDEAKALMAKDPAVSSGRLSLQCKAWWSAEPWNKDSANLDNPNRN